MSSLRFESGDLAEDSEERVGPSRLVEDGVVRLPKPPDCVEVEEDIERRGHDAGYRLLQSLAKLFETWREDGLEGFLVALAFGCEALCTARVGVDFDLRKELRPDCR